MKPIILAFAAVAAAISVQAQSQGENEAREFNVTEFQYMGPIQLPIPVALADADKIQDSDPLKFKASFDKAAAIPVTIDSVAPGCVEAPALHFLSFDIENRGYSEGVLSVEGLDNAAVYCDGKEYMGSLKLTPATHNVLIRYQSQPDALDSLHVTVKTTAGADITLPSSDQRMLVLDDMMCGTRVRGAQISPAGNYILANYVDYGKDASQKPYQLLYDAKTGKKLDRIDGNATWLPNEEAYYIERKTHADGRHLVKVNPKDMSETVMARNLPDGYYQMSPTADYLVYALTREGRKEDSDIYQVLEPEDRQPGWRDRTYPAIYRFGENVLLPLAIGKQNAYVIDITDDGAKMLLHTTASRLERRPTTVTTIMLLDVPTMQVDTIVNADGFVSTARFSPDGQQIMVTGSPEAFGRVGCVLPDSVIPSMIEQEIFIVDLDTKKVRPITRDFDPSVQSAVWSKADGKIYASTENRDMYTLYVIDSATGAFQEISAPETLVFGFDVADNAPMMTWWGQSDSNSDRLYAYNTKTKKHLLLDAPSDERFKDVKLAKCEDWNFVNSKGDTIYGRYYLPDNFDPTKKYPLIVNYYGGCSPSQRYFESRYPWHIYSELGYVVYVVQPSGATGFGQEFSSRHVNTAGRGPAEDIIEGTKKFVEEHEYVNPQKIGCIGASYGGFMTQYLQTITDIFAAAVSHAGISDHTSYWGEGYWGYSYSEVSMAESYPWSDPDLYVKQSPLYNADKIHTPILFLHGDADTNVPVGESIQMFTALKLLGRPTAFVEVAGQNHLILDISKRRKWQDTINAWFSKYLQDDPTWWDALYPGN